MPISTPLKPEVIVGNKPKGIQSAQNFISGGAPLGSSVVSAAANKIVGFQRAGVRPVTPDINSLVKSISSNILNQVNNTMQSAISMNNRDVDRKIRNQVTSVTNQIQQIRQAQGSQVTQLQSIIQNIRNQTTSVTQKLLSDYKDRIQKVDAAKPTNILGRFLDTFNNALGFIRFFGNKKNIDELTNALKTLRNIFLDSFEVAKLVRNTIVKIVKQLSNLPKASPNSGGLNLDVNVPRGIKGKTKLPRFAKAAGIFGLGALGAATATTAVNALSDVGTRRTETPSLMGGFGDRFSEIVDRFVSIVEGLSGKKRIESRSAGSSGGGGGGTSTSSGPGSSPGGAMPTGSMDVTADTEEEKAWLKTIRQVEGTSDETGYNKLVGGEVVPELTQMTLQEVYDLGMKSPLMSGKLPQRFGGRTVKFGADSHAMGAYQFKPQTMLGVAKQLGMDPNTTLFTPEVQDQLGLKNLSNTGVDPTKTATIQDMEKAGTQWAGLTPYYGQTSRTAGQSLEIFNKFYGKSGVSAATGMGGMGVDPSKLDLETKTLSASKIAQPPPTQQSSPTVLPLPMEGGGTQSKPAPNVMQAPPSTPSGSYAATLLGSSDTENFFTLYSKITFNIVDG